MLMPKATPWFGWMLGDDSLICMPFPLLRVTGNEVTSSFSRYFYKRARRSTSWPPSITVGCKRAGRRQMKWIWPDYDQPLLVYTNPAFPSVRPWGHPESAESVWSLNLCLSRSIESTGSALLRWFYDWCKKVYEVYPRGPTAAWTKP